MERCRFGVRIDERFVGTADPLWEEAELLRPSRLVAILHTMHQVLYKPNLTATDLKQLSVHLLCHYYLLFLHTAIKNNKYQSGGNKHNTKAKQKSFRSVTK